MQYEQFTICDQLGSMCNNQSGLFTPRHEKHNLKITIKNEKTGETHTKRTTYQYNPQATIYTDGDGLRAVVCDALAFAECPTFSDFVHNFGYDSREKASLAFRGCRASFDFFKSCGLSAVDLEKIQNELDNMPTA